MPNPSAAPDSANQELVNATQPSSDVSVGEPSSVDYFSQLKEIRVGNEQAKSMILKQSVKDDLVAAFGMLSFEERLGVLSAVREMDAEFRQKSVPVLTALMIFIFGALALSGNTLGESLELDGVLVGSITAATLGGAGMWGVAAIGRNDAVKESRHAAWLQALEAVDSRATKLEAGEN